MACCDNNDHCPKQSQANSCHSLPNRQRQKFLQLFAPWGVWPFGGPGEQADHATNLPCLCFDHLTLVHARRMVLRLKNGNDTHRVMMPYDSLWLFMTLCAQEDNTLNLNPLIYRSLLTQVTLWNWLTPWAGPMHEARHQVIHQIDTGPGTLEAPLGSMALKG